VKFSSFRIRSKKRAVSPPRYGHMRARRGNMLAACGTSIRCLRATPPHKASRIVKPGPMLHFRSACRRTDSVPLRAPASPAAQQGLGNARAVMPTLWSLRASRTDTASASCILLSRAMHDTRNIRAAAYCHYARYLATVYVYGICIMGACRLPMIARPPRSSDRRERDSSLRHAVRRPNHVQLQVRHTWRGLTVASASRCNMRSI
jgi:hypothetical protein